MFPKVTEELEQEHAVNPTRVAPSSTLFLKNAKSYSLCLSMFTHTHTHTHTHLLSGLLIFHQNNCAIVIWGMSTGTLFFLLLHRMEDGDPEPLSEVCFPTGGFRCSVTKSYLTLRSHELQHARPPWSFTWTLPIWANPRNL